MKLPRTRPETAHTIHEKAFLGGKRGVGSGRPRADQRKLVCPRFFTRLDHPAQTGVSKGHHLRGKIERRTLLFGNTRSCDSREIERGHLY
jgi:hypothetical protein